MIIIKLIGGLGNQLFQYSLGRHLSIRNNAQLKLDVSGFETYKLHKYSLYNFNIVENFSSNEEVKKLGINNKILKNINNLLPLQYRKYIKESGYLFAPMILDLKDNVYLEGYWQSEKYFKDIEDAIKKEITLKVEVDELVQNLIDGTESVSLHIRRADYVTSPKAIKVYSACSLEYYRQAIDIITKKISNPNFFVFSDDIDWAKKNLKINYPLFFVDHGAEKNYEDLILMSKCRHNIIANSSFSWWGAWLNNNSDKIIIAPKKWFNDNSKNTSDLLPNNWIKI